MSSITDRFPSFAQVETALALLLIASLAGILLSSGSLVGAAFEGNWLLTVLLIPVFLLPAVVILHALVDLYRVIDGAGATIEDALGHLARVLPAGTFMLGIWLVTQVDPDAEFDPRAIVAVILLSVGTVALVGMVLAQAGWRLLRGTNTRTET
ncbi:hypothetical protein [Haloarchaeobius sp. HME9146]|uniref:hypothetical protein n=1 Tax=Haloarchaeobius sp. HME9146 TaxID=2978732 RepID=UPI0021C18E26|nr:hypothetical protein [Haloarchaeobius sp. HME9146]MCT9095780.1 hypothetical protein [Haloarchaeobius sp. HME9146]